MELRFNPRKDSIHAFSTPVFGFRLADSDALNRDLKTLILAEEQRDPGLRRSNVGGWHSRDAFLSRNHPAITAIHEVMVTPVRTIVPHIVGDECAFDMQFSGGAKIPPDGTGRPCGRERVG